MRKKRVPLWIWHTTLNMDGHFILQSIYLKGNLPEKNSVSQTKSKPFTGHSHGHRSFKITFTVVLIVKEYSFNNIPFR